MAPEGGRFAPEAGRFAPGGGRFAPAGERFASKGARIASDGARLASDGGCFAPEDGRFPSRGGRFAPEEGSLASRGGRFEPDDGRFPSRGAYVAPEDGSFPSRGGRFELDGGRLPVAGRRSPNAAGIPATRRRGAPAGGASSAGWRLRGDGAVSSGPEPRGACRAVPRRCCAERAPMLGTGGPRRLARLAGAPWVSRRRAGDFAGFSRRRGSGAGFGTGRQRISSLPRCWTGAASRLSQMPARCASRSSRSSECTRTLTSSCAVSATSISCSTAGESPAWPIATTGWSGCARARSSRRCEGVSVIMRRV